MDANLRKIQVMPPKRDKFGEITKDECALVSFEIDLGSKTGREGVMELMELLRSEWVQLIVEPHQYRLTEQGDETDDT